MKRKYTAEQKEHSKEYFKNYYLNNKLRLLKKQEEYYKNHKVEQKEYQDKHKQERALYRKLNSDKIKESNRLYRLNHKKEITEYNKNYRETHKEEIKEKSKIYNAKNRRKIQTSINKRRREDIGFRMIGNLRHRVWTTVKNNYKTKVTLKLIGCSVNFLKSHLASKFTPGMSWENYGKWHIDHIRPCASFDLSKPSEQRKCFHYTNLQPLWAEENLSKNDKY
jgi:hypothetical protein